MTIVFGWKISDFVDRFQQVVIQARMADGPVKLTHRLTKLTQAAAARSVTEQNRTELNRTE